MDIFDEMIERASDATLRAAVEQRDEARRERDEARRTCSLVQDDFTRVERERDEARAAHDVTKSQLVAARAACDRALAAEVRRRRELSLAEHDERIDQMDRMYDEVSAEATESLQRIKELEAELAASTDRERQWREWRQGDKSYVATSPAADWRKTRDEMLADLSEWLDLHDKLAAAVLLAWLLRWEPKS